MPVEKLNFAGSRDAPKPPDEVMKQWRESGRGEPPPEVIPSADQAFYFNLPRGSDPIVTPERVEEHGDEILWKIDVHTEMEALAHRPAHFERRTADEICNEIDEPIDVSDFRPQWAEVDYSPPLAPQTEPVLKRLHRGFIEPYYVFGTDNRLAVYPSGWPWRCVGKTFSNTGEGSAVLVGKSIIVTAGHVVPWDGGWIDFVPAYYNGKSVYGDAASASVTYGWGYDASGDVCGYDWAICVLDKPLGSWLGYFGYNGYTDDWEDQKRWCVLGYPGMIAGGEKPAYQFSVSVFDDDSDSYGGRELETEADTSGGNSGGPLYGWFKDGTSPRVIGVCSGSEYNTGEGKASVFAGGSGFTNMITWGRQKWG